jgi:hypothetical protein
MARSAGYFRSSLLEVAAEAITGGSGKVRIICNSDLDPDDLATATAAQAALRRSWCAGQPELAPPSALPRYQALYQALISDKIEIRVLPDTAFGLIHGKAGVIRYADRPATAFLGSVNESASAWKLNYELLWESDEPDTIAWVQEEFDALWNDYRARPLADCPFIQMDVQRILHRRVVEPEALASTTNVIEAAASAAVESPIYRREQGLWPHQKYFARLALERHRLGGARLVLVLKCMLPRPPLPPGSSQVAPSSRRSAMRPETRSFSASRRARAASLSMRLRLASRHPRGDAAGSHPRRRSRRGAWSGFRHRSRR